jgi:hypothetical protein
MKAHFSLIKIFDNSSNEMRIFFYDHRDENVCSEYIKYSKIKDRRLKIEVFIALQI